MNTAKITAFIIASLLFIIVFGVYYHLNNSKSVLENSRDNISTLIEKSKTETQSKYSLNIEDVDSDLRQNKMIPPAIRKWFENDFLATGRKEIIKERALVHI